MRELTRDIFIELWNAAKAGQTAPDEDLSRVQKYMMMHEDMHEHFERVAADPSAPLDVDGENLALHVLMDASTEKSLETDEPSGVRMLMQQMLSSGFDPGVAFHVLSQAMQHEFLEAVGRGEDMEPRNYLRRAAQYAEQAAQQRRS